MKKVVLASALFALPAFAEDAAVETTNDVAIEQQHAAYEGFYAGIGFEASEIGHKIEYTWPAAAGGDVDLDANHHQTRLAGAVVFGFGKKMKTNRFYAGIEAGLSFGPTTNELSANRYGLAIGTGNAYTTWNDLNVRHNSFIPSLALRFGVVDCETKIMTYIKLGAAYSRVKCTYMDYGIQGRAPNTIVVDDTSEIKCNGVTPIVALGVEKAFAKRMTGRLEAEYRFGHSKTESDDATFFNSAGTEAIIGKDSTKLTQKGTITLRAMFCYNVRI